MDDCERQKLDAMKELAYGASHEINNPLANIAARAQSLLREERHPERRRTLEAIHHQALRAHEMISDLMLFARPPQLMLESVDLGQLVAELGGDFAEEAARCQIEMQVSLPSEAVTITADRQQLRVALAAMVTNAMEAIGREGAITLSVSATDEAAIVSITDNGPGIPAEVRPHIFDPFFSGREAGRGLGFGLSKCWRIVGEHGGTIEVAGAAEDGATFVVRLPLGGAED